MMLGSPAGDAVNVGSGWVLVSRDPHNRKGQSPSTDSESSSCETAATESPDSNEFRYVEGSHASRILDGLNELRVEGQFCDVTLIAGGVKFPAHKNVLSALSPFFKAMFVSKMRESHQSVVPIKGVEPRMLELLIDFAYTATIIITRSNVQALLSAANLLQVLPVLDAACLFLEKHMDSTNCLRIHYFAESHSCLELQEKARDYALKNFKEVCLGDEFMMLLPGKLVEFLRSDDLDIEEEEIIFQGVLRWLNSRYDQHEVDFHEVLQHIRLPLLSPSYLYDSVENVPAIRSSPKCMKLVEEAKLYHLLPDWRAMLQSTRTKPRKCSPVEVIVAVGGKDENEALRSVECYFPSTHSWRTLSCLPSAVCQHGLVASGKNTLYMAGGLFPDWTASKCVWRYDPVLDQWQEVASMLVPRFDLGLVMLDGYMYAVGGCDGYTTLDSVERYDPSSNSWSLVAPMSMAETCPAVVAHDAMLYVTGLVLTVRGDRIGVVKRYNPHTNEWEDFAPMWILDETYETPVACVLDGLIYLIGGWKDSDGSTNRVQCYDVKRNKWEFKQSMCERRYRPGVSVIDGYIYVLGGQADYDIYHGTMECYNPKTDTWTVVGEMPTRRSQLGCVSLQMKKAVAKKKSS